MILGTASAICRVEDDAANNRQVVVLAAMVSTVNGDLKFKGEAGGGAGSASLEVEVTGIFTSGKIVRRFAIDCANQRCPVSAVADPSP